MFYNSNKQIDLILRRHIYRIMFDTIAETRQDRRRQRLYNIATVFWVKCCSVAGDRVWTKLTLNRGSPGSQGTGQVGRVSCEILKQTSTQTVDYIKLGGVPTFGPSPMRSPMPGAVACRVYQVSSDSHSFHRLCGEFVSQRARDYPSVKQKMSAHTRPARTFAG